MTEEEKKQQRIHTAAEAAVTPKEFPNPELQELLREERRVNQVKSAASTGMTPMDMDGIFDEPVAKLETGSATTDQS